MAIYCAYMPPDVSGEAALTRFELVPEGKALLALIFPLIWLVIKRLWLALLVYLLVSAIIVLVAAMQPGVPIMYLAALPGFYLLLEGNELVRRKMERNGWRFAGVVDAENRQDAEVKFIAANAHLFGSVSPTRTNQRLTSDAPPALINPKPAPAGLFPE